MKRLFLSGAILVSMAMDAIGQPSKPGTEIVNPIIAEHSCHSANFPISKGDVSSCCQQGSDIYQVVPHSSGPLVLGQGLGHRQVGTACTNAPPSPSPTNCIALPSSKPTDPNVCHFGPCGAHIVQTWTGTRTDVFLPNTQPVSDDPQHPLIPAFCGYETTNRRQVVVNFPEPFDHQSQYPGVTAGCPYNACLTGGIPVVAFTINVVVATKAAGQTTINPGHMILIGAANTIVEHEQGDLTVTAVPTGPMVASTRVTFSGACNNTGANGETRTCKIPFVTPHPQLTVTYHLCGSQCDVNSPVGSETH